MQYQIAEAICQMMNSNDENLIFGETDARLCGEVPFGAIQKVFLKSKMHNTNHFNMSMMFELSERV